MLIGKGRCFITAGLVTILQSVFILKLPAVGENPSTADAAGISVTAYRYIATIDEHSNHNNEHKKIRKKPYTRNSGRELL